MKQVLSIVIPVYNVEKYLPKCLDSIYTQGVNEKLFEVIVVIDGSPDNSFEIVQKYAQGHSNIVILEKDNGGVSSARNLGINYAQGDYLIFVDPDDTLFPGSLVKVIDNIKTSNCDIIIFRTFYENTSIENYLWHNKVEENKTYSGREMYERYGTRYSVCGVAFSRKFWLDNKIEFPINIINGEDSIVFIDCQLKAKYIKFSNVELYCVFTRVDSASHHITCERLIQLFETLKFIKKRKDSCVDSMGQDLYDGLSYSTMSVITKHAIHLMGFKALPFLMKKGIKSFLPISSVNLKRSSFPNRIIKKIANRSYRLFFLVTYLRVKL